MNVHQTTLISEKDFQVPDKDQAFKSSDEWLHALTIELMRLGW